MLLTFIQRSTHKGFLNKCFFRYHHDIYSATKFIYKKGFTIKSFKFENPPLNCKIELKEIEQLTQGIQCHMSDASKTSVLHITYQPYPSVLQDLHQEFPRSTTKKYRWNSLQEAWIEEINS